MIFGSKLTWGALLLAGAFFAGCQQEVNAPDNDKGGVKNTVVSPTGEDPKIKPIGGDTLIECGTPDSYDPNDLIDPVPADPLNGKCGDPFPDIAIKCASDLSPVCGCDGKTYRNGCYAMGVGHVWVKSEGACPGQPYVEE